MPRAAGSSSSSNAARAGNGNHNDLPTSFPISPQHEHAENLCHHGHLAFADALDQVSS